MAFQVWVYLTSLTLVFHFVLALSVHAICPITDQCIARFLLLVKNARFIYKSIGFSDLLFFVILFFLLPQNQRCLLYLLNEVHKSGCRKYIPQCGYQADVTDNSSWRLPIMSTLCPKTLHSSLHIKYLHLYRKLDWHLLVWDIYGAEHDIWLSTRDRMHWASVRVILLRGREVRSFRAVFRRLFLTSCTIFVILAHCGGRISPVIQRLDERYWYFASFGCWMRID